MGEVLNEQFGRTFCRLVNPTNCFEIPPLGGIFYSLTSRLALFGLNAATTSGPFQRMALPATECSTVRWQKYVYHNVTLSVLHTFQRLFNRLG